MDFYQTVCALILFRSGLGLVVGKLHQFLTDLSARDMSIFSFLDNNFIKCQWIFTRLGMCIDIVKIWFWIVNEQIWSILTELSAYYKSVFYFQDNNLSKSQWIFTKFDMCIDSVEIWFGIAHWQISFIFYCYRLTTWWRQGIFVSCFYFICAADHWETVVRLK